jgi:hypothetical protein
MTAPDLRVLPLTGSTAARPRAARNVRCDACPRPAYFAESRLCGVCAWNALHENQVAARLLGMAAARAARRGEL